MGTAEYVIIVRELSLFILLIAATFTDIAYGKIYNWLLYPAIALGAALAVLTELTGAAYPGIYGALGGMIFAGGIFGFFFVRGWIGPADVKLAAAIGALKGFRFFFPWALVYITLAGFMLAVIVLIWQGKFWATVKNSIIFFFRPKKLKMTMQARNESPVLIPYGVAMAFGTMCAWFACQAWG